MHAANLKACTITFWNLVPLSQSAPLKTVSVDASKLDNCKQMEIYSDLIPKTWVYLLATNKNTNIF